MSCPTDDQAEGMALAAVRSFIPPSPCRLKTCSFLQSRQQFARGQMLNLLLGRQS